MLLKLVIIDRPFYDQHSHSNIVQTKQCTEKELFIFVSVCYSHFFSANENECLYKGSRKKKKSSTSGRATKEKRTFFKTFFFILLPFKNKNYFTLDNLSKYGHITLKFVGRYFHLAVTIFSKNRPILVQKLWGEKKSKSVFGYFKNKKKFKKKSSDVH